MPSDFEPAGFTNAALEVLNRRILRRDVRGNPLESPGEMFHRVAWAVAGAERAWNSEPEVHRLAESFFRMMQSLDIHPDWHVRMQAAFQRHVDSAVSKTVNLRREATRQEIANAYLLAHELGCNGITVFRDGCKCDQVLAAGAPKRPMPASSEVCPECGGPMEHASACLSCLSCGYSHCTM